MDKMTLGLNRRYAAAAGVLLLAAGQAMAAVPADVTTAVGDMKTDALAVGVAVLVAIFALGTLKFIRKAL